MVASKSARPSCHAGIIHQIAKARGPPDIHIGGRSPSPPMMSMSAREILAFNWSRCSVI